MLDKTDKKTVFNELYELVNGARDYSDRKLYHNFYMRFATAECFDDDYLNNLNVLKGKYSINDRDSIYHAIIPLVDQLSVEECCTLLSFVLRAERWSEGWFKECLQNGSIQSLLARAREIINNNNNQEE